MIPQAKHPPIIRKIVSQWLSIENVPYFKRYQSVSPKGNHAHDLGRPWRVFSAIAGLDQPEVDLPERGGFQWKVCIADLGYGKFYVPPLLVH